MKTNELTGAALDWAVAEAMECPVKGVNNRRNYWQPSTDWAQGGPIIERERIALFLEHQDCWCATDGDRRTPGDTPLIAAMRCYVASKLGDAIDIPEALK